MFIKKETISKAAKFLVKEFYPRERKLVVYTRKAKVADFIIKDTMCNNSEETTEISQYIGKGYSTIKFMASDGSMERILNELKVFGIETFDEQVLTNR